MKKTFKRLTAYVLAAILLLPYIPVSASTVKSVDWKTEMGTVVLSDTPTGPRSAINCSWQNNVKISLGGTADYAAIYIVPIQEGIPAEATSENTVLAMQQPVIGGTAEFSFKIKPNTADGTYALFAGGTDADNTIGYFDISITNIMWETYMGVFALGSSPTETVGAVNPTKNNTVKITFDGQSVEYASLIIVPVQDGAPAEATSENTVLAMQQPVTDGMAVFSFYLKPSVENGIYALCAGGTQSGQIVRYFEVNNKTSPGIKQGQIFGYDEYKDSLKLELDVDNKTAFADWAANKSSMTVKLGRGEKSTVIASDDVSIDIENETLNIDTRHYAEVFPEYGEEINGGICQMELSVSTPEYWGSSLVGGEKRGYFGLIIPEFSAAGFARGVDFELSVYSEEALNSACPIVSLYDNGILIGCVTGDELTLTAGETRNVKLTLKCEDFVPSGKLAVRIMLWDGAEVRPLTSYVSFQ